MSYERDLQPSPEQSHSGSAGLIRTASHPSMLDQPEELFLHIRLDHSSYICRLLCLCIAVWNGTLWGPEISERKSLSRPLMGKAVVVQSQSDLPILDQISEFHDKYPVLCANSNQAREIRWWKCLTCQPCHIPWQGIRLIWAERKVLQFSPWYISRKFKNLCAPSDHVKRRL